MLFIEKNGEKWRKFQKKWFFGGFLFDIPCVCAYNIRVIIYCAREYIVYRILCMRSARGKWGEIIWGESMFLEYQASITLEFAFKVGKNV